MAVVLKKTWFKFRIEDTARDCESIPYLFFGNDIIYYWVSF